MTQSLDKKLANIVVRPVWPCTRSFCLWNAPRHTPRMRPPPAYRMTYDVRAYGPTGLRDDSRLRGTVTGDGYELVGVEREESLEVFARLTITSWQPYEDDAIPDALRMARDLCNVLSVAYGNQIAFEPTPPASVEALDGAKGRLPVGGGITMRVSAHAIHVPSAQRYPLDAAAAIHEDPPLRADLDTWRLAMREPDGPTRLLHYFRIYEREARSLMEAEPALLRIAELESCASAVAERLPGRLSKAQRERVNQTIMSALSRLRTRSRGNVLADAVGQALGSELTASDVRRIDKARGRYAHEGAQRDTQPPSRDEELLERIGRVLLRRAIDAHLPAEPSSDQKP